MSMTRINLNDYGGCIMILMLTLRKKLRKIKMMHERRSQII